MNAVIAVGVNHSVPERSMHLIIRIYTTLNYPDARTYFVGIYLAQDLKMVTYIQ